MAFIKTQVSEELLKRIKIQAKKRNFKTVSKYTKDLLLKDLGESLDLKKHVTFRPFKSINKLFNDTSVSKAFNTVTLDVSIFDFEDWNLLYMSSHVTDNDGVPIEIEYSETTTLYLKESVISKIIDVALKLQISKNDSMNLICSKIL